LFDLIISQNSSVILVDHFWFVIAFKCNKSGLAYGFVSFVYIFAFGMYFLFFFKDLVILFGHFHLDLVLLKMIWSFILLLHLDYTLNIAWVFMIRTFAIFVSFEYTQDFFCFTKFDQLFIMKRWLIYGNLLSFWTILHMR
jgi:hypothetical protein